MTSLPIILIGGLPLSSPVSVDSFEHLQTTHQDGTLAGLMEAAGARAVGAEKKLRLLWEAEVGMMDD
jgi:hypothetical protein